jgi:hypothetical protein
MANDRVVADKVNESQIKEIEPTVGAEKGEEEQSGWINVAHLLEREPARECALHQRLRTARRV